MAYPEYPENSRSCLQHTTDFYTGHCVSAKARWNCVCNLKCHSFGFWVLQSQAVIVWKFDVYIPLPSEGNYDVTTALAIPTAQTSSRKCHFGLCLMDAGVWNVCVSIFFFRGQWCYNCCFIWYNSKTTHTSLSKILPDRYLKYGNCAA